MFSARHVAVGVLVSAVAIGYGAGGRVSATAPQAVRVGSRDAILASMTADGYTITLRQLPELPGGGYARAYSINNAVGEQMYRAVLWPRAALL
jgi:hypothetical protein